MRLAVTRVGLWLSISFPCDICQQRKLKHSLTVPVGKLVGGVGGFGVMGEADGSVVGYGVAMSKSANRQNYSTTTIKFLSTEKIKSLT